MTARDEAIQAMGAEGTGSSLHYGDLLDLIPADVLARLAVERGGLIGTVIDRDGDAYDSATGALISPYQRLYRLTEGVGE